MRYSRFDVLADGALISKTSGSDVPADFIVECEKLTRANMLDIYEEVKWQNSYSNKIGYCEKSKLEELKKPGVFVCAFDDDNEVGRLVGFLKVFALDRVTAFIMELQVDQQYKGRGVGRAMMEMAEKLSRSSFNAKRLQLCVQINNVAAQGFYQHLDYSIYKRDPKFLLFSKRIIRT